MRASLLPPQKIPGFESTDYALLRGRVVWMGEGAHTRHPRNARRPWRAPSLLYDAQHLREGAHRCVAVLDALPAKGLLLWLVGQALPFPMQHAAVRLDAMRGALERNDLHAFEAAALRLLGLGQGLTPSGDDFVGGACFALRHAPRDAWCAGLPTVLAGIRQAARTATNVISAAFLDDLIDGSSYGALHELLAALQGRAEPEILRRTQALLRVGASSGADMLAGLLATLLTTPCPDLRATT